MLNKLKQSLEQRQKNNVWTNKNRNKNDRHYKKESKRNSEPAKYNKWMNDPPEWFKIRFKQREERISKLEEEKIEIIEAMEQEEKNI